MRLLASRGSLAFSVAVAVVLVAMVGGARGDPVPLVTGQGTADDATASSVLFAPESGSLQIEDVATGALTDVPLPSGQQLEPGGRLIAGGALFVSDAPSDPQFQLNEWDGGTLTPLGPGSGGFAVAGDYAIWNDGTSLYRRTISAGANVVVSSNAGNTENDVAANGDVVYWTEGDYTVHRWRDGVDSVISQAPSPLQATSPLTDGTTVLYRETNPKNGFGQVAFSDGTTETVLDESGRSWEWPESGSDYALDAGWIAYTGSPTGVTATEVWVRSPSGTLSRVSPAGADSCTYPEFGPPDCGPIAQILGVNPTGQVLYRTSGDLGVQLALGAPGDTPFPLPSFGPSGGNVAFAFWENGHWYVVVQTPATGWQLFRFDTDTAILSAPSALTNDNGATFTFTSSAQSASYECSLDGHPAAPCSSPVTYTGLPDGTHTLSIDSTDTGSGEADPTPATATWTVDTTPPAAPTLTGTDPPSGSSALSPSIQGSAESGSTVRLYTTDDCTGDPVAHGSAADFASPGLTVHVTYDSTTSYRATATDAAGNTSACSAPITYTEVSPPPTVQLFTDPAPALTGATVTFSVDASSVYPITDYQWDLDGDGTYETDTGTTSYVTHSYSQAGDVTVRVRVTNSDGKIGTKEVTVSVRPAPPPGPIGISIDDGDYATNSTEVQLDVVWPAYAAQALISNDGGFGSAGGTKTIPLAPTIPWTLRSAGSSGTVSQTVYLRFPDSSDPNQTYADDIILDTTSPTVQSASLAGRRARTIASGASALRRFKVRLHATEKRSGISEIEFSARHSRRTILVLTNRKRRGILRLRRTLSVRMRKTPHWVRVRSAAGNWSRWHRIK